MLVTETLRVKGVRVQLQEGDLIFTRWDRVFPSYFIGLFNDGISHAAIVLRFNGRLYNVDACLAPSPLPIDHFLKNERGVIVRNGVHGQLLEDSYTRAKHMWVHRPTEPYTESQLRVMRERAMVMLNEGSADPDHHTYETCFCTPEYFHAIMGWPPYTINRYMCSEAIAIILKAGGRWQCTTSVTPIKLRDHTPGTLVQVF
jgi:hypothetical protein